MTTFLFWSIIAVLFCTGLLGACPAVLEIMETNWRLLLSYLTRLCVLAVVGLALIFIITITVLCALAVVGG